MTHGFVFPGQGAQSVGMLADLAAHYTLVRDTFAEASEYLNYDLWELCQTGPAEKLNRTERTQPALLAAGVAVWRIWQAQGGALPRLMAGHSFGEYTALVCAGALPYHDAVKLAEDRGRFMQSAVPVGEGAMAAILGMDNDVVLQTCRDAEQGQIVAAVNYNAPGQVVIAGHHAAVQRAMDLAKQNGARKVVMLNVSAPSHCDLMRPAAESMAVELTKVAIQTPSVPIVHNVDLATRDEPHAIREALIAQLYRPVRWVETVEKMLTDGCQCLIETGPGKVLTGLNKRISRQLSAVAITDCKTLDQALALTSATTTNDARVLEPCA